MVDHYGDDGIYISLTVPPGAEPGVDSLAFDYQGNELEVLIPHGSSPGDVLRIQVGTATVGGGDGDGTSSDVDGGDTTEAQDTKKKQPSSLIDELGGMVDEDEKKPKVNGLLAELGGIQEGSNDGSAVKDTSDAQVKGCNNDERSNITKLTLGDGLKTRLTLQLFESLPSKGSNHIKSEGDGTHAMMWPSGKVMAEALTSPEGIQYLTNSWLKRITSKSNGEMNTNINCLELGSGLGVCGLALAYALGESTDLSMEEQSEHQNKHIRIVLTDQGSHAVELLKANIQTNISIHPILSTGNSSTLAVSSEPLTWGDTLLSYTNDSNEYTKNHILLGSDLLYNTEESYDPLLKTIQQHLHRETGIVMLAARWRKPDLERSFFQKAETIGLHFELWTELAECVEFRRRCPCVLGWREYGNPDCEESNNFFHETMVSIAGANGNTPCTKSLAEVTEADMERMNDEEYTVYEELQVQLYIGKFFDSSDDNEMPSQSKKRSVGEISN